MSISQKLTKNRLFPDIFYCGILGKFCQLSGKPSERNILLTSIVLRCFPKTLRILFLNVLLSCANSVSLIKHCRLRKVVYTLFRESLLVILNLVCNGAQKVESALHLK